MDELNHAVSITIKHNLKAKPRQQWQNNLSSVEPWLKETTALTSKNIKNKFHWYKFQMLWKKKTVWTDTRSNVDKTAFRPFAFLFNRSGLAITQIVWVLLPRLGSHAVATLPNTCSLESLSVKWFIEGLSPSGRLRFSQLGLLSLFTEHTEKLKQEHKTC